MYQIESYSEIVTTRRDETYTNEQDARRWFAEYVKTWERLGDRDMLFWVRLKINTRIVDSFANVPERHAAHNYFA
jgi:hypothetical protein